MSLPRTHLIADLLGMLSGTLAIAAWQEQLDWALRILASAMAITVGCVALYQRMKKRKMIPLD